MPTMRSSRDEIERALSVLASRDNWQHTFQRLAASAGLTISPAACWLLCKISRIGPSSAERLSGRLQLPAVVLTQPLQELTRVGLLNAESHQENGRTGEPELYSLTSAGQEAHRLVLAAERDELDRLLKGWSPDQMSELAALLTQMSERFLIGDAGDGELVAARPTGVA
jgi:DNA-binding MarR family transcriptional regulator